MAKTKVVEGKFLLASHKEDGYRTYGDVKDGPAAMVLPPGVTVPIDRRWLDIPAFAHDVQKKIVSVTWSNILPDTKRPDIGEEFVGLDDTQKSFVRRLCLGDLSAEIEALVKLHERLGPGGMTPQGVSVTKTYLKNDHVLTLRAALDLEARYKNRAKVMELLADTIRHIEAL